MILVAQNGYVLQTLSENIQPTQSVQFYVYDGEVSVGDPVPAEAIPTQPRNGPFVDSPQLLEKGIQIWLEVYGDWINDLNYQLFGKYRSKLDLLKAWDTKMKG